MTRLMGRSIVFLIFNLVLCLLSTRRRKNLQNVRLFCNGYHGVINEPLKASVRQPAQSSGFPYVNYNREFQKIRCGARRYPLRGSKNRFGEESGRQSTGNHVNKLSVNFELRTPSINFPLRFFRLGGGNSRVPPPQFRGLADPCFKHKWQVFNLELVE